MLGVEERKSQVERSLKKRVDSVCRVHFLVKTAVRGTHGNWTWPLASTNKALVRSVQRLSQRTSIHLRGNLWCKHVYGHSNHAWNDRADELARLGK